MSCTQDKFLAEGFGQRYAWLDLVNSEQHDGYGHVTEHLRDSSWIRVFLSYWNLGTTVGSGGSIDTLRRLRIFLRRTAQTMASRKNVPKTDLAWINERLQVCLHRRVSVRNGGYIVDFAPARRDWNWQRAEMLRTLVELLADGLQSRVKVCPNPGCRWVFFDRSHGNTRKWCSDSTCGNRDKVRRLRARRRRQSLGKTNGRNFSRRSSSNVHPEVRD
jgi:predicted RNA-binding Zn ribbon-like protein